MARRVQKVTYTVTLDPASGRWNVARNGAATGGFARQSATAIGIAYGEASREQAGTDLDVRVFLVEGRQRRQVWPTD